MKRKRLPPAPVLIAQAMRLLHLATEQLQKQREKMILLEAIAKNNLRKKRVSKDPISQVKQIIADILKIDIARLHVKAGRKRMEAWPRHLGVYFCELHKLGVQDEICEPFGYKDHSSVGHARESVLSEIETNSARRTEFNLCKAKIAEYMNSRHQAAASAAGA